MSLIIKSQCDWTPTLFIFVRTLCDLVQQAWMHILGMHTHTHTNSYILKHNFNFTDIELQHYKIDSWH